jgi:hypothetical protein
MKLTTVRLAVMTISVLLTTGCASTKVMPVAESANKSVRAECVITSGVTQGKEVTVCAVDAQQIDAQGKNIGQWKRSVQVYDNEPTAASMAKTAVGTIPGAIIQGEYGKSIARTYAGGGCRSGNCGTLIVNETNAAALASSVANSASDVDIKALKDFGK